MRKFGIVISFWITLIISDCIILSGIAGMDTIEFILWSIICGTISMLIGLVIYRYIETKLNRRKERKESHRKELVERILKPLQLSIIKHKDFKVFIDDLEKLEKQEEFSFVFQHLQHTDYSSILTSWKNSKGLIKDLNKKLEELETYIDSKVTKKYKSDLSRYIWDLVQTAFYEDTKMDYLKIEKIEDKSIVIPRNERDGLKIPCIFGETKTKNFLSKIINPEFRNHLKEIQEKNNKLNKEFKGKFQELIKGIVYGINNKECELKGGCKICSFWKDC